MTCQAQRNRDGFHCIKCGARWDADDTAPCLTPSIVPAERAAGEDLTRSNAYVAALPKPKFVSALAPDPFKREY